MGHSVPSAFKVPAQLLYIVDAAGLVVALFLAWKPEGATAMSAYVICMDRNESKIFSLNPDRKDLELVRRVEIKHHTHADPENHKKIHPYFQEIAEHIRNASEILLIGPGQIKIQFSHHLKEVYPHTLGRTIVGVETVDHPTDNQILEFSRNFFRQHDPAKYPVA